MIDRGIIKPGSIIYFPFGSYVGSSGASVTLTGLAVTDIEVYKDGSMTQRASDSGYALLDTDGIDIDGITGIHGFSIDLADNATAGFWAAGSRYFVVISAVTIDGQTVNFVHSTFVIGIPGAILDTTIATLTTQTSFTLSSGPAEDDALNGCLVYIHDVASAVQGGFAYVADYTGATKTVTLAAGTTFTAAATDNISVLTPPTHIAGLLGSAIATPTVAGVLEVDVTHWLGSAAGAQATVADILAASLGSGLGTLLQAIQPVRVGTAQAGGASTITLDASASATNEIYTAHFIQILSGTGAGQTNFISAYVGATKVATVRTAWVTVPDATSVFMVR